MMSIIMPFFVFILFSFFRLIKSNESICSPPNFMRCNHEFTTCVRIGHWCNGKNDCPIGEDEWNCSEQCSYSQFRCRNGTCVSKALVCDKKFDCVDQSDEIGCLNWTCHNYDLQWQCRNSICITKKQHCNKVNDCGDASDEEICCKSDEWMCHDDTRCVGQHLRCNGDKDCKDNSDEKDCHYCTPSISGLDRWRCQNDRCIFKSFVCNNVNDCGDNSDEKNCYAYGTQNSKTYTYNLIIGGSVSGVILFFIAMTLLHEKLRNFCYGNNYNSRGNRTNDNLTTESRMHLDEPPKYEDVVSSEEAPPPDYHQAIQRV